MIEVTAARRLAAAMLAAIFLQAHSGAVAAAVDDYPNKPIRWIVPTSPSGGTDFIARMLSAKVAETLRQTTVVDNRAGAAGMVGMEVLAKAAADGYSVGVISVTPFLTGLFARNPGLDVVKDFSAVSLLARSPMVLVAHPSSNIFTMQDLVTLAKAQPGKLNYASAGSGSITHLAGELLKRRAGINLVHVPYKGTGPAMNDLLAGHVQFVFASPSSVLQYIRTGRLRAIAITSEQRASVAPDVPTFREAGVPDMVVDIWYGMLAPAGTSPLILEKLAQSIAAALNTADLRAKMAAEGSDPVGSTPAEFKKYLSGEYEKWTKLVREIDFRPD